MWKWEKILFCKIVHMKYYKGKYDNDAYENDIPWGYNEFTKTTGRASEECNFLPQLATDGEEYCFGTVYPKSTNGDDVNEIHIENIVGCRNLKDEDFVDDVLVVWFAPNPYPDDKASIYVVGWYKHATVYRYYDENDGENIIALAKDCVLLSDKGERRRWGLPKSFNFGQPTVRYPKPEDKEYVSRLIDRINSYSGENWLYKYPSGEGIIKI